MIYPWFWTCYLLQKSDALPTKQMSYSQCCKTSLPYSPSSAQVAQLMEHLIWNHQATCSSPAMGPQVFWQWHQHVIVVCDISLYKCASVNLCQGTNLWYSKLPALLAQLVELTEAGSTIFLNPENWHFIVIVVCDITLQEICFFFFIYKTLYQFQR